MRFHNFRCISFVSSESLKHVQKTPKSWEKVCSITIFHQNPEKTLLQAWKTLKTAFFLPTSFSDNHGQKSWDTFAFLGCFSIHTGPTPPLTPQTMLNACIQNFCSEIQLCIVICVAISICESNQEPRFFCRVYGNHINVSNPNTANRHLR